MAFISSDRRFVFVHLHKCGGTSVELALSREMLWNDILLGSSPYGEKLQQIYDPQFGLYKHSSAQAIRQVIGQDLWESSFTFATIRHPLDRLVSYYCYLGTYYLGPYRGSLIRLLYWINRVKRLPASAKHIPKINDAFRWPEIVAYLKSRSISEFIRQAECWQAPAMACQFQQLCDADGQHLIVKHITPLERLDEDWAMICSKTGISQPLPHVNKSKRKYQSWRKYFSLDDINFLEEKYKADLDAFGYTV